MAEFERELPAQAMAGSAHKLVESVSGLTPFQRQEAAQRLAAVETQADVARTYGVGATTIRETSSVNMARALELRDAALGLVRTAMAKQRRWTADYARGVAIQPY